MCFLLNREDSPRRSAIVRAQPYSPALASGEYAAVGGIARRLGDLELAHGDVEPPRLVPTFEHKLPGGRTDAFGDDDEIRPVCRYRK